MPEIILHHDATSTFSERVRLALGLKGLSWRSVDIPAAMPKPDLVPLTGGYRRTPVMQIGADVFCDTQFTLRRIEALRPEPSLYPGGCGGLASALAWWADRSLFAPALGLVADAVADGLAPDFVAERRAFGFPLAREEVGPVVHRHLQQGAAHLAWLAAMLADGRPYLLGPDPSAADLAAFCPLWLLRRQGGPAAEALDLALRSEPEPPPRRDADPSGLGVGEAVWVTPDDTGLVPAHGRLLAADADAAVIRHDHPRVGAVNIHFPRAGFDVVRA